MDDRQASAPARRQQILGLLVGTFDDLGGNGKRQQQQQGRASAQRTHGNLIGWGSRTSGSPMLAQAL